MTFVMLFPSLLQQSAQNNTNDITYINVLHCFPVIQPRLSVHFMQNPLWKDFFFIKSQITRPRTHLWPDAGCILRQRPSNIV